LKTIKSHSPMWTRATDQWSPRQRTCWRPGWKAD